MTTTTHPSGAGLAPTRTTLDNGIVVVAKETRKTPAVSINLAVRAGSVCDPAEAPGAMNLLARVIDRGTNTRSGGEIAEALDSRGISLNVTVSRHLFSFMCTCLAEDFEPVISLVADMMMSPSAPETELATRKGEVITAIRQDDDSPAMQAVQRLLSTMYGEKHPYGQPGKGSIDSVERLARDQLLALHRLRFAPSELTAVVVGDVETSRSFEIIARAFAEWHVASPDPVAVASPVPAETRRRVVIPMMNKAQADIAYGFISITRLDPAYYAFHLMNNALGQYALGGRLGDSIRERQGMAYYVSSSLDAGLIPGPLIIRAGVNGTNVDRTISSIDEELAHLRDEGLTQKELDESRQYLIGSMPRSFETNEGIANYLQTEEFFGLGLDHDLRLPGLLDAVTLEDVRAAADRVIDPARATIAIAGPYDDRSQ